MDTKNQSLEARPDAVARGRLRALRVVIRQQERMIRFLMTRCHVVYPDGAAANEQAMMRTLNALYRVGDGSHA